MEMTIKQLAEQLGVSKTTISKAIFVLGLQGKLKRSGNKYLLSEVQIENVKTQIANQKSQTEPVKSQTANQNALIDVLQKQLFLLNEQLSIKDDQITAAMENITAALTASQALHAGTIQQQLTDQSNSKENSVPDDPEQPKQKQGFFSKFFGKKNN